MHVLVLISLTIVVAVTASPIPSAPWDPWAAKWPAPAPAWPAPAWPADPWHAPHHHHAPVATSYANVWKVDHHAVPVVVKPHPVPVPVAPVVKVAPAYGWAGWDHHVPHHDPWAAPAWP